MIPIILGRRNSLTSSAPLFQKTFSVHWLYILIVLSISSLPSTIYGQVVPVGSGSYTKTFPGTDAAGRNDSPSGTPQLSGQALNKPVPTNDWWSNLIKNDHGGQVFNYPLSFRSENDGLVINYTIPLASSINDYREPMSAVDAIKVGVTGLNAAKSTVSDYSDWTVTSNWASGSNNFSATMGMGMPFVYFTKATSNVAQVKVDFNSPGVSISGNKLLITNNINNANYVVFAPSGSSWTANGGTFTSTLAGKNYWSMALVPPGMNVQTFISNFERYAYVFPASTQVNWDYNESNGNITTTFTVTPEVKEGTYSQVLLGLLPHQWAHLGSSSPQPTLATYPSVRGVLKMMGSNTFTVQNKFSGILPTLPNLAKYSDGFDITSLYNKVDQIKGEGLPAWTDSYNEGQNMNRLIQAARIADQIGHTEARDKLLNTVQERLEDWLMAEGGEVAFLFYYDSDWSALLGYPAGHRQDVNLNDHHFHWGYFIHAAAALEQFRPGWASNWGEMINMLVRDAGNPDRSDSMFPFLRNFSPYAGHAWANGFATEPFGNDQESTSESMQFNASLIHWGAITNNKQIRDLGIYLYTTEVTAIQEYWFDVNDRTFQPEYGHEMMARIWGAGYDNGTWWTSDIAASYGIQLYPIHGGSLYMGYDLDYVQEVWNGMTSKTGVLNNTPNDNLWYDTYWSFLAFLDPQKAIDLYDSYTNRNIKVGISDAQTYHWLHTMNAMGQVADEITADYPIASVFIKDGVKTYVAHNYSPSAINVHFSDGYTLYVPAGEMATSKDTGISINLNAPGVIIEPCVTGENSHFNLEANITGVTPSYIEFYRNGTLIATDNSAPYSLPQSFSQDGVYTYLARAYSAGGFELSNLFRVVVGLGTQQPYSTPHTVPGTFESGLYDKGGNGISYFDVDPNIYEANFRTDDEVDAASSPSQGTAIGWIAAGEWVEYSINATPGKYDIDLNIASKPSEGGKSGNISLEIDCNAVGNITSTPLTGDWDTYQAVSLKDINITGGRHIIRVTFNSGVFNLGRLKFTRIGDIDNQVNTPPTQPTALTVSNASVNSIAVTWNASTDAENNLAGYRIYRNNEYLETTTNTAYTYTGLTANTSYNLAVEAVDTENALSARASVTASTKEGSDQTDGCTTAVNNDFSVEVITENGGTALKFIPKRANVGSQTCILYYSNSPDGAYPGYLVTANTAYPINAAEGTEVYYYYTYSVPEGGERNTFNNKQGFVAGACDDNTEPPTGVTIPAIIQAEDYTNMSGVQTQTTSDDGGGLNVGWIDSGDWIEYEINVPNSATYTIHYRVASLNNGGNITLSLDGNPLNNTSFEATGGWQNWETVTTSVDLTSGNHTLRLTSNSNGWNINWIEFATDAGSNTGGACKIEVNDDFYVNAESNGGTHTMTFVPKRAQVGSGISILYYSTSASGTYPGYVVQPDQPFAINAQEGATIYFYYTYSLPQGGENNTYNNKQSFITGNCTDSSNSRVAGAITQSRHNLTDDIRLYPNPANTQVSLEGLPDNALINIYDAAGRLKLSQPANGQSISIDISNLSGGLHIIKVLGKSRTLTINFFKD